MYRIIFICILVFFVIEVMGCSVSSKQGEFPKDLEPGDEVLIVRKKNNSYYIKWKSVIISSFNGGVPHTFSKEFWIKHEKLDPYIDGDELKVGEKYTLYEGKLITIKEWQKK